MSNGQIPRIHLVAILLCFFLSGAAGLAYQVAWSKALGLVFGHTVYAIATVLAVFMAGLALGSALLGRWSERHPRPVALYGWIEFAVAATGALSLLGLAGVRALYQAGHPLVADFPPALLALRFLGSALVLFAPTFLMGGTLPILVRGLTRQSAELGSRLSRLYWVNTLGAVGGTLAAGFWLLPMMGLRRTVAIAVALNILAGIIALLIGRRHTVPVASQNNSASPRSSMRHARFLLVTFALVGATAMAYEVAWTRMLATLLGSSTYAFTVMLATFLVGIVLGSMFFELWHARGGRPSIGTFALTQTLTAIGAVAFLLLYQYFPQWIPTLLEKTGNTFTGLLLIQCLISAAAMLPAALVFGFNFPVVAVLIAQRNSEAGDAARTGGTAAAVGTAYAANTLGAIAGATAAGFLLVPLFGSYRVVAVAAAVNLALALVLEIRNDPRRLPLLVTNTTLLIAVAAVAITGAFYNRSIATFSALLYHDYYHPELTVREMADTTDILFAEDGLNASVSVARAEDYVALRSNGKVDASTEDLATQLLSGHLGMVFHPAPKRVLIIGFGSGMTVSAVARHPGVERIDCVEIEPAVIRAAAHLERLNRRVLEDPRVHIVLDDARNFLLTTRERYDLIISEPSNPWIAGVASLFTDEFYREARARLAPGGLFVQWVQAYSLDPSDVRMVLATFLPHFPRITLWHGERPDLLLLAQTEPATLSLDRFRSLWSDAGIREDFRVMGVERPEGLLAFHLLDDQDLRSLASAAPRNTDDRTRLEYSAPRTLLAKGLDDKNLELIAQHRTAVLPRDVHLDDFNFAMLAVTETLLNRDDTRDKDIYFESLRSMPLTPEVAVLRARWDLENGLTDSAREMYESALHLDPKNLAVAVALGDMAQRRLEFDTADILYRQVLARDPKNRAALSGMSHLEMMRNRRVDSALWQARLIEAVPTPTARDHGRLGELLFYAERYNDAKVSLNKALALDPADFNALRTTGRVALKQERWEDAALFLARAIRYQPTGSSTAYAELVKAYRQLGDSRNAALTLAKGLRIYPSDAELAALTKE